MFLRTLFVVLLLANVGYFLWSKADDAARQAAQREPQRLTQQVQPQWLKVVPAGGASAPAPAQPASPAPAQPEPTSSTAPVEPVAERAAEPASADRRAATPPASGPAASSDAVAATPATAPQ